MYFNDQAWESSGWAGWGGWMIYQLLLSSPLGLDQLNLSQFVQFFSQPVIVFRCGPDHWPVTISQPTAERDSFCPDRRSWSVPGRSSRFDTGSWHSVTSAKSCHTSGFLLVHQSWLMFSTSSMMAALISKIVFFGANIRYPDIKFKCQSIFSTSGCNVSLFTLDGINPVNPLVNSCHLIM